MNTLVFTVVFTFTFMFVAKLRLGVYIFSWVPRVGIFWMGLSEHDPSAFLPHTVIM